MPRGLDHSITSWQGAIEISRTDQPRRSYGVGVSDDLGGFVGLGVLVGWRVGVGLGVLVGLMVGVGAVVGSAVGPGSVAMSVGVAWICVGMIEVFDGITKGVPVKITRRVAVGVLVGVEVRVGWPSGGIVDVGRVEVGDGVKVYVGVGEPVEVGDKVKLAVSVMEGVRVMVSVGEGVRVLKSVENAWIVSALSVLAVAVDRPPVSGSNRLGSMRSECEERYRLYGTQNAKKQLATSRNMIARALKFTAELPFRPEGSTDRNGCYRTWESIPCHHYLTI